MNGKKKTTGNRKSSSSTSKAASKPANNQLERNSSERNNPLERYNWFLKFAGHSERCFSILYSLLNRTHECLVCYQTVSFEGEDGKGLWCCSYSPSSITSSSSSDSFGCGNVFHSSCIRKWAEKSVNIAVIVQEAGGKGDEREEEFCWFKCPGCQKKCRESKTDWLRGKQEHCFCGISPVVISPPQLKAKNSKNENVTSSSELIGRTRPPFCGSFDQHSCPTNEVGSIAFEKRSQAGCTHFPFCPFPACHPGPCPPCQVVITDLPCPCGQTIWPRVKCFESKDGAGLPCSKVCSKPLQCALPSLHGPSEICSMPCHEGECPKKFEKTIPTLRKTCFCKRELVKIEHNVPCHKLSLVAYQLQIDGKGNILWPNSYACSPNHACAKVICSGGHLCNRNCHSGPCDSVCEFDPSRVTTCPCGAMKLEPNSRTSCLDPIPSCGSRSSEKCGKKLTHCFKGLINAPGNHICTRQKCHTGPCSAVPVSLQSNSSSSNHLPLPCNEVISISCSCGRVPLAPHQNLTLVCSDLLPLLTESGSSGNDLIGSILNLKCDSICHHIRSCGRHECGRRCCPLNRGVEKVQKKKKKFVPLSKVGASLGNGNDASDSLSSSELVINPTVYANDIWTMLESEQPHVTMNHECPLQCGKRLSCQNHVCSFPCHPGPCLPCLEASFTEWTCGCGRTRLEAPIPCGFKDFPICPYLCSFENPPCLTHPRESSNHPCHPSDTPCPPCPVLIQNTCPCGRTRRMLPCNNKASSVTLLTDCSVQCPVPLPCGHQCSIVCHVNHEDSPCTVICGKISNSNSSNSSDLYSCKHACKAPCHYPFPCLPCTEIVMVPCHCGSETRPIPCNLVNSLLVSIRDGKRDRLSCAKRACLLYDDKGKGIGTLFLKAATAADASSNIVTSQAKIRIVSDFDQTLLEQIGNNPTLLNWLQSDWEPFVESNSSMSDEKVFSRPVRAQFRRIAHAFANFMGILVQTIDPEPHTSLIIKKVGGSVNSSSAALSRKPSQLVKEYIKSPTEFMARYEFVPIAGEDEQENEDSLIATPTIYNGILLLVSNTEDKDDNDGFTLSKVYSKGEFDLTDFVENFLQSGECACGDLEVVRDSTLISTSEHALGLSSQSDKKAIPTVKLDDRSVLIFKLDGSNFTSTQMKKIIGRLSRRQIRRGSASSFGLEAFSLVSVVVLSGSQRRPDEPINSRPLYKIECFLNANRARETFFLP